ncbi:MAG: valine--tRNA ligase [Candidatus Moraniibacteriota bacterium]
MAISIHYDYKKTEKKWSRFWEKNKIFRFNPKKTGRIYSIDTPPPYVSGDHLHVGHAMSYTQAEVIVRFHRMLGKNIFYPMGFDDNGLPTERHVEKKYHIDKSKISRKEFTRLCLDETKKGSKTYTDLWTNLGLSVDWSRIYSTIARSSQKVAQLSYLDIYQKGRIYQAYGPIFWCPYCQTALAQADLEDREEATVMYDIDFKNEKGKPLTISTTRPELIFACAALYVNPTDKRYKNFIGKTAVVPLVNRKVKIGSHKSVEKWKGTGIMMVCTWGDTEDVEKWKEDKLDTWVIFDKRGYLNEITGKYQGIRVREARKTVVEDLKKLRLVRGEKKITHVLNIHERCKNPIEFYASNQWFIKILDLKKELLQRGKMLNWHPKSMRVHFDNWVKGLKWDWCISRDRFFGVPFPVWRCQDCENIILPKKEQLPVDPREQKPPVLKCPKCQSKNIFGETQVMDTWMTSSVTPLINARWGEKSNLMKQIYPMSLRVQAMEIIRTWLFYTVVKSHLHTNTLPWKDVMISGHGTDHRGEKMSKSLGNFVKAEDVIGRYGADALRWWACGTTLGMNVRYSEEDIRAGSKLLTKLWNVTRFVFMNCPKKVKKPKRLYPTDQWILAEAQELIKAATKHLNNYEFGLAGMAIEKFFWTKLTDNYLELIKGRLYGNNQAEKQSAQFTLLYLLNQLIHLLAPYLPFITEEIYQKFFRKIYYQDISLHIRPWPAINKRWINSKMFQSGDELIESIEQIRSFKAKAGLKIFEPIKNAKISGNKKPIADLKKFEQDIQNVGKIENIEWQEKNISGIKYSFN